MFNLFHSRNSILIVLLLGLLVLGAPFMGYATAFAASPAQAAPAPIPLTPELLSSIVAILASLAFAYVPGLKTLYGNLTSEWKAAVMGISLLVIAAASLAIGCAGWLPELQVTCDRSGIVGLLSALVTALVANQGTYLLAVKPFQKGPESTLSNGASNFTATETNPLAGLARGRTVHYVTSKAGTVRHLAATVVHVWTVDGPNAGMVNLFVPPDMYDFDAEQYPTSVRFDPTGTQIGSWHWPERV